MAQGTKRLIHEDDRNITFLSTDEIGAASPWGAERMEMATKKVIGDAWKTCLQNGAGKTA